MVAARQGSRPSLRERSKVLLSIIPISYREWNTAYDCNCELVLVFEEGEGEKMMERRKKLEEAELEEEEEEEEEWEVGEELLEEGEELEDEDGDGYEGDDDETPPPSPTPSLEDNHLVEIIEGLYIALVDDGADALALRTFDDKAFTHIVQVNYTTPVENEPSSLLDWRREECAQVRRLDLNCAADSLFLCAEQTAVGPFELYAARDFLTLALPHGSTKWWPEELRKGVEVGERTGRAERYVEEEQGDGDGQVVTLARDGLDELLSEQNDLIFQDDDDGVNVVIVAPTSRAVDVLSVLFCYLAYLEGTTPENITLADYCDQVWESVTLGRWSLSYVEMVARYVP